MSKKKKVWRIITDVLAVLGVLFIVYMSVMIYQERKKLIKIDPNLEESYTGEYPRYINEVNEDDIDILKVAFQILNIRLHQLGLTGSTNARDNLDVRSTIQFNDSVEILCSCNCFHIVTHFQKSNIFHFLKLLRCIYYTVC